MSFPTTSILDSFNRANETPLSGGGNWVQVQTLSQCNLASNQAVASGSLNTSVSLWNPKTFKDSEIYFTINTILTVTNDHMEGYVRFIPSSLNGYSIGYWKSTVGSDTIRLEIITAGSLTTLSSFNQTISAGDSIGMSIVGSTLTAYYKPSGGSWSSLGSTTDSTYSAAGNLIIEQQDTSTMAGIINFGGGTYVPASSLGEMNLNTSYWGSI